MELAGRGAAPGQPDVLMPGRAESRRCLHERLDAVKRGEQGRELQVVASFARTPKPRRSARESLRARGT